MNSILVENLDHILIFKTNIKTSDDKQKIKTLLDINPQIEEWSVDCENIDCVLRIVSHTMNYEEISKLINSLGYECQELE